MHSNILRRAAHLALALLLLVGGCHDEPEGPQGPQLPPETQTGAGTLGFKIGDRIYVATSASGRVRQTSDNTIAIESGHSKEDWGFALQADSIFGSGIYILDTSQVAPFSVTTPGGYLLANSCVHKTFLPPNVGKLTITRFDLAARVISGRFEIQMFSIAPQCPSTISITDGRFDVRF